MTGDQISADGSRMVAKSYQNQIQYWKRDTLLQIPQKEGTRDLSDMHLNC